MDQTGTAGVLASMKHPKSYDNGARCLWNIRAPEGKRVHLHFESFSLEDSQMCLSDSVFVLDHISSLGMLVSKNMLFGLINICNY